MHVSLYPLSTGWHHGILQRLRSSSAAPGPLLRRWHAYRRAFAGKIVVEGTDSASSPSFHALPDGFLPKRTTFCHENFDLRASGRPFPLFPGLLFHAGHAGSIVVTQRRCRPRRSLAVLHSKTGQAAATTESSYLPFSASTRSTPRLPRFRLHAFFVRKHRNYLHFQHFPYLRSPRWWRPLCCP